MKILLQSALVFLLTGSTALAQGSYVHEKFFVEAGSTKSKFGTSVSMDAGRVAIGDPALDGGPSTHVGTYRLSAGLWDLEAGVYSQRQGLEDDFGKSLELDGDTLVVGAPRGSAGLILPGVAYVFTLSGQTWTEVQQFVPAVPKDGGVYGYDVALDGDTLAIGAPRIDAAAMGEVEVWVRSGATWSLQQTLVPAALVAGAHSGSAVVIEGDRIAIGAPHQTVNGFTTAGRVYVFERTGSTWSEVAAIDSPAPVQSGVFGTSLALEGDRLVVGAPGEPLSGSAHGRAHVFVLAAGQWSLEQTLIGADTATPNCRFGAAVAIEGTKLVVGVPGKVHSPTVTGGSVKQFRLSGGVWTEYVDMKEPGVKNFNKLGESVDLAGELVVGGDPGGRRAFLWHVDPPILSTYCTAKVSSAGCLPSIGWFGSPSATPTNAFRINADEIPNQKVGLLIYSHDLGNGVSWLGGYMCIANILRVGPQNSGGSSSGNDCTGELSYDFGALIASGNDPLLTVGSWGYAQFWFRDPPASFTSGLSDAIRFRIEP